MKKNIAIVAGGNLSVELLSNIKQNDVIIGVDRGAYWLLEHEITPDIAIGDFDSVNEAEFADIKAKSKKVIPYPHDKDWTDLELAISHAIKLDPQIVEIYGGFGTRLDHSLAAVQLLEHMALQGVHARILDERNILTILRKSIVMHPNNQFQYISLLPLTTPFVFSLYGFKYNAHQIRLTKGMTRGVSNELLDHDGTIDVHEGIGLLVQSRD